jgi:hypothetical protein
MNAKLISLFLLIASLLLGGCGGLGQRPAGYVYDQAGMLRGYLIPAGRTAQEQLTWVNQEENRYCRPESRQIDTIVGVAIGATVGAVLAGRGSRATGAALGGLGGGVLGSMSTGEYCSMLQTTRGLITEKIAADSPRSNCRHHQVEENGRRYTRTDCASTTGPRPGFQNYPSR